MTLEDCSRPLVSMVIPVFNGAEYLEACLESIEAQTYDNWHAVIVSNCSTDGTGTIADRFARRDPRFRVEHCTEFLPQAGNYNRAVSLASQEARFVKVVEADNILWPECIERQVSIAQLDDEIGIVGCFYLFGERLHGAGFPSFRQVLPGRDVAIAHLREEVYFFGTPTTLLFNHRALRSVAPPFQPDMLHDDVDLCLRLSKHWKFGFEHRVLAFVRTENGGLLSTHLYFDCVHTQNYYLLMTHGLDFFDANELGSLLRAARTRYYHSMGRALLTRKNTEYWDFHAKTICRAGERLRWSRVIFSAIIVLLELVLNPLSTVKRGGQRRLKRRSSLNHLSNPQRVTAESS